MGNRSAASHSWERRNDVGWVDDGQVDEAAVDAGEAKHGRSSHDWYHLHALQHVGTGQKVVQTGVCVHSGRNTYLEPSPNAPKPESKH